MICLYRNRKRYGDDMETKKLWDTNIGKKEYQFINNIDEFIEYITKNNMQLSYFQIRNGYNVMDETNCLLDAIANKNNINLIYTDEFHPIAVSDNYDSFFDEEFFKKHKDRLIETNNKLMENIIGKQYGLIIFNKHFDNIDHLNELLDKGIKCRISIEDIEIPDYLLEKIRNSKLDIMYKQGDKNIQLSSCYAFSRYRYDELEEQKKVTLTEPLSDSELDNLRYLNDNTIVVWRPFNSKMSKLEEYQYVEAIIDKLEKLNKKNTIKIEVKDRELFSKTNIYKQNYKNVNLIITNDLHDYSFDTYKKEEEKLNNLVKDIKESSMSQFEKYIAVYNIVKNFKPYKENTSNKAESRHLRYILDNEYMVCVGYAKLLQTLLNKVGIESYNYSVSVDISYDKGFTVEEKTVEHGDHARLIVNLQDDKYGINGYYISDPTWDNNLDKDYLAHSTITFEEEENSKRMFWNNDESYIMGAKNFKEFNDRINSLMKRIHNDKYFPAKDYKEIYSRVANKILEIFETLDSKYYLYLQEKYVSTQKVQTTCLSNSQFDEKYYQEFLSEIGCYIIAKSNKKIDVNVIIAANMESKKQLKQVQENALNEYESQIIMDNTANYKKYFPYEYDNDAWKENEDNKFDDVSHKL